MLFGYLSCIKGLKRPVKDYVKSGRLGRVSMLRQVLIKTSLVLAACIFLAGCGDKKQQEPEQADNDIVIEILTDEEKEAEAKPDAAEPELNVSPHIEAGEENPASVETEEEPEPYSEEDFELDPDFDPEEEFGDAVDDKGTAEEKAGSASYKDGGQVYLDPSWEFADFSKINSGCAVYYIADEPRKGIIVGVNAGHGTKGGMSVKTYCHPDKSPKTTGGSTASGATEATAVAGGMTFSDGTTEASVTLKMAQAFKDALLKKGYDVLMVRDGDDVQLDNIARTVICNNAADCHIAIHWDGDGLDYDKGCFYISVPDGIKGMYPVSGVWQEHERLGKALIGGLSDAGFKIHNSGSVAIDLTQTSYSTVASVDIELGNQAGRHDAEYLDSLADALADGIDDFF